MFSEYASKFLAQSQSRLSNFGHPDNNDTSSRQPSDWQSRGTRNTARSYLGRGFGSGNPYQTGGSRVGHFGFPSRNGGGDAPLLFHSHRGDIPEEDDEEERDREAADLYALQRSRRVFAASRLDESSETDGDASRGSLDQSEGHGSRIYGDRAHGMGIKSSWTGTRSYRRPRDSSQEATSEDGDQNLERHSSHESESSKGRMEDVGLESTIAVNEPPADLMLDNPRDDNPPAFQKFKSTTGPSRFTLRRDSTQDSEMGFRPPSTTPTDTLPATATVPPDGDIFRHDPFFAWIYLIAIAALLATFVLVYIHTSTPSGKNPLGDTIYTTLEASFHLLAVDTLISIIVSLVWLAALRSFVRPLVYLILVAVPVIMFSFSLYPMISSYQGPSKGKTAQDRVMWWASLLPGFGAFLWIYLVWKGRYAIRSAVDILDFASRILSANPALVLVGMGSLGLVVLWTWAWLLMFTRVFLGGYFSTSISRFIISASSWWLGIYFVLMYIWTLSVISGVQRATTGATVSQWYFHRNVMPAPSSREVVSAALNHALTTIFGSICFSTLLALLIRIPLLVLPRRLMGLIAAVAYSFVPTPITALTNPLTVTYSAIHSQNLTTSARGLSQMEFLSPQAPTMTLTPRAFRRGRSSAPLLPYRLAKLLLHATRFMMATALGFAGWVMTARQLRVALPDGMGIRGSAYAYVVGLVASFIGWGVLGAMESILSGIVDAAVICYGSEARMPTGGGGFCMEAAALFGDRREDLSRDVY